MWISVSLGQPGKSHREILSQKIKTNKQILIHVYTYI